jgi:hypothetical protein
MAPAGLELLDEAQQVADRTDEAVEPYHDQRFTGGVLLQDCGADRSAEFVALRISSLFVGETVQRWGVLWGGLVVVAGSLG